MAKRTRAEYMAERMALTAARTAGIKKLLAAEPTLTRYVLASRLGVSLQTVRYLLHKAGLNTCRTQRREHLKGIALAVAQAACAQAGRELAELKAKRAHPELHPWRRAAYVVARDRGASWVAIGEVFGRIPTDVQATVTHTLASYDNGGKTAELIDLLGEMV